MIYDQHDTVCILLVHIVSCHIALHCTGVTVDPGWRSTVAVCHRIQSVQLRLMSVQHDTTKTGFCSKQPSTFSLFSWDSVMIDIYNSGSRMYVICKRLRHIASSRQTRPPSLQNLTDRCTVHFRWVCTCTQNSNAPMTPCALLYYTVYVAAFVNAQKKTDSNAEAEVRGSVRQAKVTTRQADETGKLIGKRGSDGQNKG